MSTHCQSCGAPVDLHAEKCAYCGTPYMRNETTRSSEEVVLGVSTAEMAEAVSRFLSAVLMTPNKARRVLGLEEV